MVVKLKFFGGTTMVLQRDRNQYRCGVSEVFPIGFLCVLCV